MLSFIEVSVDPPIDSLATFLPVKVLSTIGITVIKFSLSNSVWLTSNHLSFIVAVIEPKDAVTRLEHSPDDSIISLDLSPVELVYDYVKKLFNQVVFLVSTLVR